MHASHRYNDQSDDSAADDDDTSIEQIHLHFQRWGKMLLNDLIFGRQPNELSDVTVIGEKKEEEEIDGDIGSRLEKEKYSERKSSKITYCCLSFPIILCYPPTFPNLV